MSEEKKRKNKYAEARDSLPPELVSIFETLVEEYKFLAIKHHKVPFVSPLVLADLIRAGWRHIPSEIREQ